MKIAVFASGTGTTLQTLIEQQTACGYTIACVVSNRACQAIERAQKHQIRTLETKDWELISQYLDDHSIDMIVLAGFLAIIPKWFCEKWERRIINIHPSLLPKFGGKGMYGIHVHEAVLAAGEKVSGCTVHYVSATIDGGEIIAQATVDILTNDTPKTLSARVQQAEKELLPRVIGNLAR